MSWLSLALGLIREAATTEMGQDILRDVRSGASRKRASPKAAEAEPRTIDPWRQSVEDRLNVADRNAEMLVRMLNVQEEALIRIQKRQRIWNLALAGALLTAIVVLWFWLV